jgi:hypothetical protein
VGLATPQATQVGFWDNMAIVQVYHVTELLNPIVYRLPAAGFRSSGGLFSKPKPFSILYVGFQFPTKLLFSRRAQRGDFLIL